MHSKGLVFRQLIQEALQTKKPLQIVGAVNAYCGMLAKKTGNLSSMLLDLLPFEQIRKFQYLN
jgi:2-methylisocitrate lyase-like PEP mutase family enzyme